MARSVVANAGERILGVRVAGSVLPVARTVLLPYLVTRAVIVFVALWLQWLLDTHRTYYYLFIGHAPLAPLSALFDANWYVNLARDGYSLSANTTQAQNYAFFPLYSASISFVSSLLGGADSSWVYFATGVVLSHVFF